MRRRKRKVIWVWECHRLDGNSWRDIGLKFQTEEDAQQWVDQNPYFRKHKKVGVMPSFARWQYWNPWPVGDRRNP